MGIFLNRTAIAIALTLIVTSAFSADQQSAERPVVQILYPRDNAIVGNKVNLVLDPADIPYFQVSVNKTEYPVVDTSSGAHAYQGLTLLSGKNSITVNVLAASGEKGKQKFSVVSTRSITVFNREGFFSSVPGGFTLDPFHTRERESTCSSCHRMEVSAEDWNHAKPADVLCYTCHRQIPQGKQIHGPAALWNCLACHDPDLYPAKYAFTSHDPWKIVKYTKSVEPMVFTLPAADLFKPASAILVSKAKAKEAFAEVISYIKQNPGDRVRLEVHTDNTPLKQQKRVKGKSVGFKDNTALTAARARTLASLLRENTPVGQKKLQAVGMGEKLPKTPNKTKEERDLNNRVEIVVYPSDLKVINSQKLPVLKDRQRVVVSISYSQGPQLTKLRVAERLPRGMQYVKGSGFVKGKGTEPKTVASELVWDFGDMDSNFADSVSYIVKKGKDGAAVPDQTRILYVAQGREQSRDFDPKAPVGLGRTVKETCLKCHEAVVNKKFKHGPVDAGYCNLCHDPHASPNPAWLRRPSWDLCSTCHPEQGSGVHVVSGFASGKTHPTKNKRDPSRPGKRMSCASCHEPHSAETQYFYAFGVKTRAELCSICHSKK